MPTSTDLVTDLPADFEVFGQAVDTTTKALNPATTLGDIQYRSATANTNTRLGIGTTGQVLTVSGGVPSWAAPAAGSLTLISTTTVTGTPSTVTVSSIPSGYKSLFFEAEGVTVTANSNFAFRVNGSTGAADYWYYNNGSGGTDNSSSRAYIPMSYDASTYGSGTNNNKAYFAVAFPNYLSTSNYKVLYGYGTYFDTTYAGYAMQATWGGYYQATPAAITSISIYNRTSTFTGGTLKLYGVN